MDYFKFRDGIAIKNIIKYKCFVLEEGRVHMVH